MAEKRRKFFRKVKERDERLARISRATPPAHTLDGQLQRMRDRNRAIESGVERDTGDTFERVEDVPDDLDEDAAAVEQLEPPLRQAAPAQKTKGELPWWARAKPGTLTATAEAERERMEKSRIAKSVPGRIN